MVFLHSDDNVFKGLGLHLGVFLPQSYLDSILLLHLDIGLELLAFVAEDLVLVFYELDLTLLQLHGVELLAA